MGRSGKLKVYRAPMGFHDVYVAASSQKAALEAWGSDHDLFARGIADLVTDPALTEEPLRRPGVVIKRLRGSAAQQVAALPKQRPTPARRAKPGARKPPSRSALDEAERALADAEARQQHEIDAIAREEARLTRRRRKLEEIHASAVAKLRRRIDRGKAAYDKAIAKWEG